MIASKILVAMYYMAVKFLFEWNIKGNEVPYINTSRNAINFVLKMWDLVAYLEFIYCSITFMR